MKNKYNKGDKVKFRFNNEIYYGIINIVDFVTFAEPSKIQYDILCKSNNILYKHVFEENIINKVDDNNSLFR